MFGQRHFIRLFHCSSSVWGSSTKELLAKLRKKTGYTFANCKKALEMHENDVDKAEKWLHDQAQALGWSKANKLGGRKTSEGIVAVMVSRNQAAMVELNCETDFVSRNKHFRSLAETVAKTCLSIIPDTCTKAGVVSKALLDNEKLASLSGPDGKTLADHVAITIGLVGENMFLKRAALLNAADGIEVAGYSHPAPASENEPMFGKYAAVVALRDKTSTSLSAAKKDIGRQLCQHLVGMNPSKVGDPNTDKPNENSDNETVMIYQEFLLDPDRTVQDVLNGSQLEVIDFVRYECGEEVENTSSQNEPRAAQASL